MLHNHFNSVVYSIYVQTVWIDVILIVPHRGKCRSDVENL